MTIEDIIKYHETKAKELVEGFEALGHAQAAKLLRAWRSVPPAKVRRLTDREASELGVFAFDATQEERSARDDGHAIYAEAMRLARIEVEGEQGAKHNA